MDELTEYQLHMMELADTAVTALVFGLALMIVLVTVAVVRHL